MIIKKVLQLSVLIGCIYVFSGCSSTPRQPVASSGVKPTQVQVPFNAAGRTI